MILFYTQNENGTDGNAAIKTIDRMESLTAYLQKLIKTCKIELHRLKYAAINFLFGVYFAWATYHIVDLSKKI